MIFLSILTGELTEKYEHCKEILGTDESDYDNGESEFGIENEEDNLINSFELYQIQLFSQSPLRLKSWIWQKRLNLIELETMDQIVLFIYDSKFWIPVIVVWFIRL